MKKNKYENKLISIEFARRLKDENIYLKDEMEVEKVTFQNNRFGELTIALSDCLEFSNGIPGFERCKGFGLIEVEDESPFLRLLSLDEPQLGFVLLNPKTAASVPTICGLVKYSSGSSVAAFGAGGSTGPNSVNEEFTADAALSTVTVS